MQTILLTAGLLCLIAAIVGGGVKMAGGEIPALKSVGRQLLLGGFGVLLLLWAFNSGDGTHRTDGGVYNGSIAENLSDPLTPFQDDNISDALPAQNSGDAAVPSSANTASPAIAGRAPDAVSPSASSSSAAASSNAHSEQDLARAEAAVMDLTSTIAGNDANAASLRSDIARQSDLITLQQQNLDSGAGSPELRDQVRDVMQQARVAIQKAQAQVTAWDKMRPEQLRRLDTLKAERGRIKKGGGT